MNLGYPHPKGEGVSAPLEKFGFLDAIKWFLVHSESCFDDYIQDELCHFLRNLGGVKVIPS